MLGDVDAVVQEADETDTRICYWACMRAELLQSNLILCDPMNYNPLGSSVHGILQARVLKWVAISFSS